MAFGTGAVTTAIIGSAVGGAVGGGIGLLGNALSGGSSGPKLNTKAIKEALAEGMAQINAAIAAGRANVAGAVAGMDKKIEKGVKELRNASDEETKQFWNKLGLFNDQLINSATALTNSFNGDVVKALETLSGTVRELNTTYSEDMGAEIERYGSVENAINTKLAQDSEVSKTNFTEAVGQARQEYEERTLDEIDAAKAEEMSLGDQFRQRADAAISRFDRNVTQQSPEFLANAIRAADTLSKGALQTRMDLLATADPRAMELSEIADENAAALMSGRISADVQANLARSGAMRALQGGVGGGSGMGRNLQARDLGLTSLDLMQRGAALNDAQRRLNYDTRVAGTQINPFDVTDQMRAGEQALMQSTIGVAESDRNQRIGAVQNASGQRLQTFDRVFGSKLGEADTVRGQDMTLASTLATQARDANIRTSGMRIGATQDIYNNYQGLADTIFRTNVGTAGQTFQTGLSLSSDIYKTNVGGAGKVYDTRMGAESNIFGVRGDAAIAGMQAQAAYEAAALQAAAGMIQGNTATAANIPIQQMMNAQTGRMQSAQLWGAALQAGSSLAGSFIGNVNWSGLGGGRNFGGGGLAGTPYRGAYTTPYQAGPSASLIS